MTANSRLAQIERAVSDELVRRRAEIEMAGLQSITLIVNMAHGGVPESVISRVDHKQLLNGRVARAST